MQIVYIHVKDLKYIRLIVFWKISIHKFQNEPYLSNLYPNTYWIWSHRYRWPYGIDEAGNKIYLRTAWLYWRALNISPRAFSFRSPGMRPFHRTQRSIYPFLSTPPLPFLCPTSFNRSPWIHLRVNEFRDEAKNPSNPD